MNTDEHGSSSVHTRSFAVRKPYGTISGGVLLTTIRVFAAGKELRAWRSYPFYPCSSVAKAF